MKKVLFLHIPSLFGEDFYINLMPMGLFALADLVKEKNKREVTILHLGIERYLNPDFDLISFIKQNGKRSPYLSN